MTARKKSSSSGKREQTKAQNREAILAAARAVFARQGYAAATVRDIVRATDLSVGTFYQYFRDKHEVFLAVADEVVSTLRVRLRSARRDPSLSLEQRVLRAYRAFFDFVLEEQPLFDVLERNLGSVDWRHAQRTMGLSIKDLREDLLPDLKRGDIGTDDPDYLAAALVGIGMVVARSMLHRSHPDPEATARFCMHFCLAGFGYPQRAAVGA
jgi:AcrR family transcriptional regulator